MKNLGQKLAIAGGGLGALCVATIVALRLFVFAPFRIPQNGMYPNLPAGSFVVCRKHPYSEPSAVRRGDVVVFVRTERGQEYNYIWRVVGLPGERIRVDGDSILVDGLALAHEPVRAEGSVRIVREHLGDASVLVAYDDAAADTDRGGADVTLGPAEVFVMGDNRFHAVDSTDFGPIPFASITAKRLE